VSGSPFLDGRTITIAGAALQQRIEAAVAKAGGELTSSQVELDGPDAKNGFVNLTASVEAGQAAVQTILYDIEAGMRDALDSTVRVSLDEAVNSAHECSVARKRRHTQQEDESRGKTGSI